MKTIFVTGASGFIGQQLCLALVRKGHRVIGISRSEPRVRGVVHVPLALGDSLLPALERFQPELIVHGANSASTGQFQLNTEGTLRWLRESEAPGRVQVLLGSVSGHAANTGAYGRSKYRLEEEFLRRGQWVLKLGLVIGRGGFFLKLAELAASRRVLPLLDGGSASIYWTDVDWVTHAVSEWLEHKAVTEAPAPKRLCLVSQTPTRLRELMQLLQARFHRKGHFVPLPSSLLLGVACALERIGLAGRLPFSSDSIRSSRENEGVRWPSDLARAVLQDSLLESVISRHLDPDFLEFQALHHSLFPETAWSEELFQDYRAAIRAYSGDPPQTQIETRKLVQDGAPLEALEFWLRTARGPNTLTQRMQSLTFLCESRKEYFPYFFQDRDAPVLAFARMAWATIRSVALWLRGSLWKGRYGL